MQKRNPFLVLFVSIVLAVVFGVLESSVVFATTYTASVTTSGTVNLGVSASGNGANVATDNVNIVSTCPYGYNVSIAATSTSNTSFSDTTLYKDGNKSNTSTTKKIPASAGTKDTPLSILGENKNTWGYTIEDAATINSNFIGLTNTQTLLIASNTATSDTGIILPVTYGASVDAVVEPGEYKMSDNAVITYYLTTPLDCTSYQVVFDANNGEGTMQPQRIAEGITTALISNTFTRTGWTFIGWNTAADGSGTAYTNGQSVTDIIAAGQTITLYAQWTDCPPNNICYQDNGANSPTTMDIHNIDTNATEVDLWASNYQYDGGRYGFAGWNTKADGTGTNYGPNETITDANVIANIKSKGLKLYAKWVQSAGDLQGWTGCSALNAGDITALTDQRDNQTYAVAKLADGKCWMIENLRLDNQYTTGDTDKSLAQGYNYSFIGLADPENANFADSTISNTLYSTDGSTTAPAITGNYTGYRFPRYNNQNTSSPATQMTAWGNMANTYSVGNWYTWSAAIADTSYYSTKNQTITSTSICPNGWRLPSGGKSNDAADSDFWELGMSIMGFAPSNNSDYQNSETNVDGKTGTQAFRSYPNNFIYSGRFFNSSPVNRGSSGHYWSSSVDNHQRSYSLNFYSNYAYPGTSQFNRYFGLSVRCLAGS